MKTNAVWMVLVFVLALLAVPVIGQNAVSAQDEVRAEVAVIHERVTAVEANQARARREALALQRKVAALGKSQDGLSVRATSLENATVAVGDRLNSVESLSAMLDRRSLDNKNKVAILVSDTNSLKEEVVSTRKLAKRALGVAIVALMPLLLVVVVIVVAAVLEFWARRGSKNQESVPAPSLMDMAREVPAVIDEHVAYPQEPSSSAPQEATSSDVADEHDDTTVLVMPSHGPAPTKEELVAVDEALVRARIIRPIPAPTQPAA